MNNSILFVLISSICLSFASEWVGITNDTPSGSSAKILSGSESETTIQFTLSGFWQNGSALTETGGYILELEDGTPMLETAAPDIQKLSTSIIIPDYNRMGVEITGTEFIDFENY